MRWRADEALLLQQRNFSFASDIAVLMNILGGIFGFFVCPHHSPLDVVISVSWNVLECNFNMAETKNMKYVGRNNNIFILKNKFK